MKIISCLVLNFKDYSKSKHGMYALTWKLPICSLQYKIVENWHKVSKYEKIGKIFWDMHNFEMYKIFCKDSNI